MSRRNVEAGGRWLIAVVLMGLPLWSDAALVWEKREINVEAQANEREVVAQYRFRNAGTTAVRIVDLVTNCDCTTMELSRRTYGPGEEGMMTVRSSIGSRVGVQQNTIGVITDEVGVEPTVLQLRANIQSLVTLSAPVLSWRLGAEPDEKTMEVNAASSLRIAQLTIADAYPADAADVRIETVAEGTRYRVHVRLLRGAKARNLTVACSAKFEDGTSQELAIHGIVRK